MRLLRLGLLALTTSWIIHVLAAASKSLNSRNSVAICFVRLHALGTIIGADSIFCLASVVA
jgi:hypothetical protein